MPFKLPQSSTGAESRARSSRLHSNVGVVAGEPETNRASLKILRGMPRNDDFDKKIATLALPAIVNFAILPLVGAVDTAFVGRMGNLSFSRSRCCKSSVQ